MGKKVAPVLQNDAPVAMICLEDGLERWYVWTLVCDKDITSVIDAIDVSGENIWLFRCIEHVQGSIDQQYVVQSFRFECSNVADVTLDVQVFGLRICEQVTNSRGRMIDTDHRMAQPGNEQGVTTLATSEIQNP